MSARTFFQACGGENPIRLSISDADGQYVDQRLLAPPFLLVGQAPNCSCQLEHPDIAFRHAYLQLVDGRVRCIDLGSDTGIRWDSSLKQSGWIEMGEQVGIGPYSIRLLCDAPTPEASPSTHELVNAPNSNAVGSGQLQLVFLNGGTATTHRTVRPVHKQVTLVGRSDVCAIRLRHKCVSRVHCSLVQTASGPWIVDLSGNAGTYLNGQRTAYAPLQHGDRLQIGEFRIQIEYNRTDAKQLPSATCRPEVQSAFAGMPFGQFPPAEFLFAQMQSQATVWAGNASATAALGQLTASSSGATGGFSEEVVLALINQSSALQQQLLDQSYQFMGMMAQIIGTMHNNQSHQLDRIREDLDRVHEITSQLHEVQTQLLHEQNTSQPEPRHTQPSTNAQLVPPPGELHTGNGSRNNQASSSQPTQNPTPLSQPPKRPEPSPEFSASAPRNQQAAGKPAAEQNGPFNKQAGSQADNQETEKRNSSANSPEPSTDLNDEDGGDRHLWLTRRLAALEQERTSRWTRIMQYLSETVGRTV